MTLTCLKDQITFWICPIASLRCLWTLFSIITCISWNCVLDLEAWVDAGWTFLAETSHRWCCDIYTASCLEASYIGLSTMSEVEIDQWVWMLMVTSSLVESYVVSLQAGPPRNGAKLGPDISLCCWHISHSAVASARSALGREAPQDIYPKWGYHRVCRQPKASLPGHGKASYLHCF